MRNLRLLRDLWRQYRVGELNRYSAEAAFYALRSAVPLLALSAAVAGRFLPLALWLADTPLTALLPAEVWEAIGRTAERLFSGPSFAAFLSLGAALTLWGATSGMRALCRAVSELIVEREISYTIAVLRGAAAVLLFPLFLGIGLISYQIGGKTAVFLLALPILALFCVCLTAIFIHRTPKGRGWLRAAVTALGWAILTLGFGTYLATVPAASHLYGSLGAILLFPPYIRACLWVYLLPFTLLPPAPLRPLSAPGG